MYYASKGNQQYNLYCITPNALTSTNAKETNDFFILIQRSNIYNTKYLICINLPKCGNYNYIQFPFTGKGNVKWKLLENENEELNAKNKIRSEVRLLGEKNAGISI